MLMMVAVFALGVVLQSFLMLAQVRTTESFKDIMLSQLGAFATSLVAFFPFKHEVYYDFSQHCFGAIFLYMIFFSLMNNKKILPVITERFLILFNIVFIYYSVEKLLPLYVDSATTNTALLLGVLFLIPSVVTFLNGLLPGKCPDWMKTCFYIWYLVMSAALLIWVVSLTSHDLDLDVIGQISYQSWLTLFSLGMISMSLSVDVVNVIYIIPYPARDQSFQERIEVVKKHLKLLNSKYEDEAINPIYTIKLILLCVLIFGVNYYFLHLSDVLVVSTVFLAGRYIVGYHSQPPVSIK